MAKQTKSKDNSTKTRSKNYKSKRSKRDIMAKELGEDNIPKVSNQLSHNDPSWYIYDDTMFDGVISMPTLDFRGVKSPWKDNSQYLEGVSNHYGDRYLGMPTLNVLYMNPAASYNGSDFASSPINIAGRKLYAELSASNAKTSGYAPQDVTTLILALGQVIAIANFLKRAYGITNYYNFYNRTIPRALMAAHGISDHGVDQWAVNMANTRNRINQAIARINSIHFPGNLNYFKKCEYIYHNVFVDRDDQMPVYSMMAPYTTWVIDEESYEEGTILKTTSMCDVSSSDARPSLQSYILTLNDMVDKILTSATFNYIFADVINLANRNVIKSEFIHIDMLDIDYTVEPLYSEQYNWQIMNATITGAPDLTASGEESTPSNDVYPVINDNCIKYSPEWTRTDVNNAANYIYDMPVRIPDTNVSDDEFVELLAYHNTPTPIVGSNRTSIKYVGISDYYVVQYRVWTGDNYSYSSSDLFTGNIAPQSTPETMLSAIAKIAKALSIVHTPILGLQNAGTDPANKTLYLMSKLGAYTMVDQRSIENLRQETYLGLFKFI